MATDRTSALVPPLGDLLTVQIHPNWPHKELWLQGNPIGPKLSFTFVDLDGGIPEEMAPNYADTDVVGRAEQYKTFVGASNREWSFTFRFHAQGLDQNTAAAASSLSLAANPGGVQSARDFRESRVARQSAAQAQLRLLLEREVVNPAIWLDSLKHPVRGEDNLSHAPPPVLLTVGSLIRSSRCIVTASSLTWQGPFDPETLMPFAAEVQVTFTNVRTDIKSNLFLHRRQYT